MTEGDDFWRYSAPAISLAVWSVAAILCAALFFLGPALCAQAARSFPAMLASTFGRTPGACVQIVCVTYTVIWVSRLSALARWWLGSGYAPWSEIQIAAISAAILAVVGYTAWQRVSITAALARLSIHLAIAVLVAALIRVRTGWFAIRMGFEGVTNRSLPVDLWRGFSNLSYAVGPLALLAGVFAVRCATRRDVSIMAVMGIGAPLAGSMVIVTVVNVATHASSLYRPSGNANVAMALISGVSRKSEGTVLFIFALTTLGVLRFGVGAMKTLAKVEEIPARFHWLLFGCLFGLIVWCSAHPDRQIIEVLFDLSTETLVTASAILTVDAITHRTPYALRWIDWPATLGLLCGIGIPSFCRFWWAVLDEDTWGHPWLLPSYGTAFLAYALLRWAQKERSPKAPLFAAI